jgi:hypothetical protein
MPLLYILHYFTIDYCWLFWDILPFAIGDYNIINHWWLFYCKRLLIILLVIIGGYFTGDY